MLIEAGERGNDEERLRFWRARVTLNVMMENNG